MIKKWIQSSLGKIGLRIIKLENEFSNKIPRSK